MQTLNQYNQVPPGGFRFRIQEGGLDEVVKASNWLALVNNVRDVYHANNLPVPKNLEIVISDWLCKEIPDGQSRCRDITPPTKAEMIKRASTAMAQWASSGFKKVEPEDLIDRREICEACSNWKGESAFGIGRCGSCGCFGLKLYVATESCPIGKWTAIDD